MDYGLELSSPPSDSKAVLLPLQLKRNNHNNHKLIERGRREENRYSFIFIFSFSLFALYLFFFLFFGLAAVLFLFIARGGEGLHCMSHYYHVKGAKRSFVLLIRPNKCRGPLCNNSVLQGVAKVRYFFLVSFLFSRFVPQLTANEEGKRNKEGWRRGRPYKVLRYKRSEAIK